MVRVFNVNVGLGFKRLPSSLWRCQCRKSSVSPGFGFVPRESAEFSQRKVFFPCWTSRSVDFVAAVGRRCLSGLSRLLRGHEIIVSPFWADLVFACWSRDSSGACRAQVTMMPIGTPKVPYRTPQEGGWQWVDIWNVLVSASNWLQFVFFKLALRPCPLLTQTLDQIQICRSWRLHHLPRGLGANTRWVACSTVRGSSLLDSTSMKNSATKFSRPCFTWIALTTQSPCICTSTVLGAMYVLRSHLINPN